MILPLHQLVRRRIAEAVARLYSIDASDAVLAEISVEVPPNRALGDLAVPLAFTMARRLRKAPRVIAQEIAAAIGAAGGIHPRRSRAKRVHQLLPRSRPFCLPAGFAGTRRPSLRKRQSDRRAHRHQSEQGGAHRSPAQRRARRRVRPADAVSGARRRDPELH